MTQEMYDQCKLFVGGLSWETTTEKLKEYFTEFGEVVECIIMKNQDTGKSRGFGFVTFREPSSVKQVLSGANHHLDGRSIDPKECNPRNAARMRRERNEFGRLPSGPGGFVSGQGNGAAAPVNGPPKVFLGGLPPHTSEQQLREFFSRYGKVTEAVIMYDQEKKKSRGFGFLSFDSEDPVNKLVAEHYVTINGKQVEIKRAEPHHPQHHRMGGHGQYPNSNAHSMHPYQPYPFPMAGPWSMYGPMMPPPHMNGIGGHHGGPIGYHQGAWNQPNAAAVAAAAAAAAAAPQQHNWSAYGYPPHPWPYGQPPTAGAFPSAGQNSTNNSSGASNPTGASGQQTAGFLPPPSTGNVANMNPQNPVPNSNMPNLMANLQGTSPYQHDGVNNGYGPSVARNGHSNGFGSQPTSATQAGVSNSNVGHSYGGASQGHNTHNNLGYSFGNGPPAPATGQMTVNAHHAAANDSTVGVMSNAPPPPFNGNLAFGSRIQPQNNTNQNYHPYRRA